MSTRIEVRLKGIYSHFGKAGKKIADWLIINQKEIIHLSITELAEKCGVSEATVVRFSRKLGYEGFYDLKISIAQEVVSNTEEVYDIVNEGDNCEKIAGRVIQDINQTLELTKKVLDFKKLDMATEAILNARKIVVFGLGNSATIALDAQHKLMRAGFECTAYIDCHLQVIAGSHLNSKDVAIGISHSGSSKDIVDVLKLSKEVGATTICITNYGKSPILKYTDIPLFTSSEETRHRILALSSRIAQLAIIDILYINVLLRKGTEASGAIMLTEKALHLKKY